MTQALIELKHIQKSYDHHSILKNLSFDIYAGEFLTLLGPSGCGKTTLLRLISGFDTPDQGDILMNGIRINELPPQKRNVHTVFQNYALFPHMNVFENVAFALTCQNIHPVEIQQRVNEALQLVQLDGFQTRGIDALSGGQQQRVAIARAIINQPKVLLLDEPLSSLDYRLRKSMQIELKKLQKELNMTFIFVTHDQEEALSMSDRIIILNQGTIEQIGSPMSIYENPKSLFVAQFIGETNVFDIVVDELDEDSILTHIGGIPLRCKRPENVAVGDALHLLLRPEDIRIHHAEEHSNNSNKLQGRVIDVTYKGATVHCSIELSHGQKISVVEFFDEEYEKIEHSIHEKVYVEWPIGWEVLLNYEY